MGIETLLTFKAELYFILKLREVLNEQKEPVYSAA